jgi:thiosulfate dehydrogenase [quinone] large subunit
MQTTLNSRDLAIAHALARVGLGINIAVHGLARIGDIPGFAAATVKSFAQTFLPTDAVVVTAYLIPPSELAIGLLLIAGVYLRPTLIAGLLLMLVLTFGTNLTQQWQVAGLQLIYIGFYACLLATAAWDYYSLDRLLRSKNQGAERTD